MGHCRLAQRAAHYFPYFPGDVAVKMGAIPGPPRPELGPRRLAGGRLSLAPPGSGANFCSFLGHSRLARGSTLRGQPGGNAGLGNLVKPGDCRPRPSPELVRLFRPLSGFSFPSISTLCYAATFGFLAILATKSSGKLRLALMISCSVFLVLCWAARVALGAHWPSDVLISYYLGLLWAACLIRFALHSDQTPDNGRSSKGD